MHRLQLSALALFATVLAACSTPPPTRTAVAAAPSACQPAPQQPTLFLRGTMTLWTLREDLVFRYACDAYYLNVDLDGHYDFRITDATTNKMNLGAASEAARTPRLNEPATLAEAGRGGHRNLTFDFAGHQTLRLQLIDGGARLTIGPRSYHDPADVPVTDPVAKSLHFDSRDAQNKTPFGAVTAGSDVEFRLSAQPGVRSVDMIVERRRIEGPQDVLDYAPVARVPLKQTSGEKGDVWHTSYRFDAIGVYGFYFVADIGGTQYVYEDNADAVYWTREVGSNGLGAVAAMTDSQRIRRFRQTVYRADYQVPAWARDVVYYYIFPERFRNGDKRNDPKPGPHSFHDKSVEVHKHWLETPWKAGSGDGSDDLYSNDFFGGDLAGIIEKLDYIHDLGANALYLTPIFRAATNHKYDTADYHSIDPHFGDNALFDTLVREARKRGIRIVLDTSLNHTGSDSIYFNRYENYPGIGAFNGGRVHPESPYASWYRFDTSQTDPDKQYHGWSNGYDLPELDKSSASFRNFAFGAEDSVMNRWLDRGTSGWRMDVVPWIADDFWRDWRTAIRKHKSDALLIAETQFESSKYFLGDEFDSTMNYIFRDSVQAYAAGADARASYRNIELMRELYPPQAFYALMNLLSTHDSPRALFVFGDRDEHASDEAVALAKARLRLALLFQTIFPGAPAVFYGDEVGVTGGEDPYDRVTYPWADQGGKPDNALLKDYKRLIAMRHAHPILRHGSIDAPAFIDEHAIVLIRRDGKQWAITATNNASDAREVTVEVPRELRNATFVDALTNHGAKAGVSSITFTVPPMGGVVLLTR
jgi:glycosidase